MTSKAAKPEGAHRDSVRVLVTDAGRLGLAFLCRSQQGGQQRRPVTADLGKECPCVPTMLTDVCVQSELGASPSGCSSLKDFGRADMLAISALMGQDGCLQVWDGPAKYQVC